MKLPLKAYWIFIFYAVCKGFFNFSIAKVKGLLILINYYQRDIAIIIMHQMSLFYGILKVVWSVNVLSGI